MSRSRAQRQTTHAMGPVTPSTPAAAARALIPATHLLGTLLAESAAPLAPLRTVLTPAAQPK